MDAIYTETYKGFTIEIIPDDSPENPFEAWDCNPPIAVYSDRNITEYATQYGNVNSVPTLTREQIKANLKEILDLLGYTSVFGLRELRRYTDTDIADAINDGLSDFLDNEYTSDRLKHLESFWQMAGIPALLKTVRGYSQGDYAEVLAVATPEFQKACGNEKDFWDNPESLKPSIELFGDWCFGNVYGYTVTDSEGDDTDMSRWGFYGDYDNEYGALSEAKSAIDHHIAYTEKQRTESLKSLIRNRVPLSYRLELALPVRH